MPFYLVTNIIMAVPKFHVVIVACNMAVLHVAILLEMLFLRTHGFLVKGKLLHSDFLFNDANATIIYGQPFYFFPHNVI